MKQIYFVLLLSISLLTTPTYAQFFDLSVESVQFSADSNGVTPLGLESSMAITIRNNDSVTIEPGDTIALSIWINGLTYTDELVLVSPFMGLDEITHNFGSGNVFAFPDTSAYFAVRGELDYAQDTNNANDSLWTTALCSPFTSADWAAVSVEVLAPSNLDSFDIDNGTNVPQPIDEVRVIFQNMGTITYLQWTPISYSIVLGNDTTNLQGVLKDSNIGPMGISERMLTNQAIFPSLPDSVGTYALCAVVNEYSDIEPANDEACYVFTLVDNYDPNDPINWPWAVEETDANAFKVTAMPDRLKFEGIEGQMDVRIFTLQGALMAEKSINGPTTISTNILAPGFYSVQVIEEGGKTWGTKFVKL